MCCVLVSKMAALKFFLCLAGICVATTTTTAGPKQKYVAIRKGRSGRPSVQDYNWQQK